MDPHFKEFPFLSVTERSTIHDIVRDDAAALYTELSKNDVSIVSVTSTSDCDDSGPPRKKTKTSAEAVQTILADMFQQSNNNTKEIEPQDVAESEIVNYLREKPVSVNSDSKEDKTDPLEWWKDNSSRYKLLSTLAAKYLCVPATSVPSERVFSCTGNIVNSKRACIHPENVNMLCFLHNNL